MIWYKKITVPEDAADGKWKSSEKESFGGRARNVLVEFISGTGPVEISFTGLQLHGEIGDTGQVTQLFLSDFPASEIFVRSPVGGEVVQVWAWGD